MEQTKKRAQCVLMEHVGSMEYYQSPQQEPKQVFSDINFEALEGEVWAILGTSAFEVRLLLEIIANARPYKDGRCVLAQKGMMRKKRTILPHAVSYTHLPAGIWCTAYSESAGEASAAT